LFQAYSTRRQVATPESIRLIIYYFLVARQSRGRTLVEDVYETLKDDILAGRLKPGERLHLGEVSKANEVSLTVVREAVTRLASERLMEATPQRGFRVWPLSIERLLDLTRVRIEIESLALPESVDRGDVTWEAEVLAAHHKLAAAVNPDAPLPSPAWRQAHSGFHAALASACSSPLLKEFRQQLFDSAVPYRYWSAAAEPPKRRRPVPKEHKALLDAALAHDAAAVVELSAAHIRRTTDYLVALNGRE
jgi:DNA-binding GntR family transcriptional regulator